MQQQRRHRPAHDVRPPHDDGVRAARLDSATHEELLHPGRRRGRKPRRITNGHTTHVHRMEPVGVLSRIDPFEHPLGVDMIGDRQLHDHPVDPIVVIEPVDGPEQLGLAGRVRKGDRLRQHARRLAVLPLHPHVHLTRRVLSHEHHRQAGHQPPGAKFRDLLRDVLPDRGRDGLPVDDVSGQCRPTLSPGPRPP